MRLRNPLSEATERAARQREATLQAWQLAVLRYAVTLQPTDRIMLLAAAAELDRPASDTAPTTGFRYFTRLSIRLGAAIAAPDDPASADTCRNHLACITEPRLQHALAAALGVKPPKAKAKRQPKRIDLWKGLGR
jgi:hypothetical protein